MTNPNPDVPLRFELDVEVPGTPEQVWDALATAKGISAWMLRTDMEEREGGAVTFHMGPGAASHGHVTAYDAPTRLVYEEDIATLLGKAPGEISPLVTEFVVDAKAGGTCVVRVVSSAFGHGADWEREFFDGMAEGWMPSFTVLRLYLERHAGKASALLDVTTTLEVEAERAWEQLRAGLGIDSVGQTVDLHGTKATVESIETGSAVLAGPDSLWTVGAFGGEPGQAFVQVLGHLYAPDAQMWVDAEQAGWQAWFEQLLR